MNTEEPVLLLYKKIITTIGGINQKEEECIAALSYLINAAGEPCY